MTSINKKTFYTFKVGCVVNEKRATGNHSNVVPICWRLIARRLKIQSNRTIINFYPEWFQIEINKRFYDGWKTKEKKNVNYRDSVCVTSVGKNPSVNGVANKFDLTRAGRPQ